jgi:hypothetical protein
MDMFHLKTKKEIEDMLKIFWEDTEYLMKIRILLRVYPKFNITKLESRNVEKLWQSLSIEQRKNIFQDQYKYQISQI